MLWMDMKDLQNKCTIVFLFVLIVMKSARKMGWQGECVGEGGVQYPDPTIQFWKQCMQRGQRKIGRNSKFVKVG
jgi:hypothetical protein